MPPPRISSKPRTPVGIFSIVTFPATATLCAAAVDDVVAWILLAGVVGITRSGSPAEAGVSLLLVAFFLLVVEVDPALVPWLLSVGSFVGGVLCRQVLLSQRATRAGQEAS